MTFPDSLTSIGDGVFMYCTELESVILPQSVTTIGGSAFQGCTGLTSVILPQSVTEIGAFVFGEEEQGEPNMYGVRLPKRNPRLTVYRFEGSTFDDADLWLASADQIKLYLPTAIESAVSSGTTLTCTVTGVWQDAVLVAAWYDANGRLLGTKTSGTVGVNLLSQEVTITGVGEGSTWKVMLVDKATFAPLCAAWDSKKAS